MKLEIIKPEVDSKGINRDLRNCECSEDYFKLVYSIEDNMSKEEKRDNLRQYYILYNVVLDKYKETMNRYLSMTHIPGKFKRGTKRRTVGENLEYNKLMREKIDNYVRDYDMKSIFSLLVEVEGKLKEIPKPEDMAEKRELDRVHSVIIYGIDKLRKMVKVKYDDDNEFRTNIIDKKWKNRHRDPRALERKAAKKKLKEERKEANAKIRDKYNLGDKYLWIKENEILEVFNHGKMLWFKRPTTTKPIRVIDIPESELKKLD